jgi:deoxyribodipyrimidine photolyase-related protein
MAMAKTLILILGDQLTPKIASLRGADPSDCVILMAEVMAEAGYVPHHQKKIAFLFSAMRHFADELRDLGWVVDYVTLDDPANAGSLSREVLRAAQRHGAIRLRVTEAGEWRVLDELRALDAVLDLEILPDSRFVASHAEFHAWAEGRKALRMEYFYRDMRRKTGLLMDGEEPTGGQWNFDHDNRKAWPGTPPEPMDSRVRHDHSALWRAIVRADVKSFGQPSAEQFAWPLNRMEALRQLDHFVEKILPHFGDFQDAMSSRASRLFHSLLSFALNTKMLNPREVVARAEAAWHEGRVPLTSAEGFIRQILGWREYVRGVYWANMPGYTGHNVFGHHLPLPTWFWSGQTRMRCLAHAIRQSLDDAHAHHIQRLMVIGNFALLAGLHPAELHRWYLGV